MPSIRDLESFQESLDKDLSRRKKELIFWQSSIKNSDNSPFIYKAAIVILCAHFEGFLKKSSCKYLDYVKSQNCTYKELKNNFIAMKLEHDFVEIKDAKYHCKRARLIDKIHDMEDKKFDLRIKETLIDTESNPTSKVVQNVIESLGLSPEKILLKEQYIDNELIKKRNTIAHEGHNELSREDAIEIYNNIYPLLDIIKEIIIEGAEKKAYLKFCE